MVNVRSYLRIRYGKEEHVCAHTRRYPNTRQLQLPLNVSAN